MNYLLLCGSLALSFFQYTFTRLSSLIKLKRAAVIIEVVRSQVPLFSHKYAHQNRKKSRVIFAVLSYLLVFFDVL